MALPTIVVVPAACQTPAHYQPLASALQKANFTVAVIPLPSVGASPGLKSFDEDVAAVRKVVGSLIDDDTEVIVLLHSYGGLPGSAAMKGLGSKDRAKEGLKGGVKRLVYVSSYALREGEALPDRGDLQKMRSYGEGFDEKVYFPPLRSIPRVDSVTSSTSRLVRSLSANMSPPMPSSTTSLPRRASTGPLCSNHTV